MRYIHKKHDGKVDKDNIFSCLVNKKIFSTKKLYPGLADERQLEIHNAFTHTHFL